jgi:hypothetical protein
MANESVMHHYRATDREELFEFLREVYSAEISARLIKQWIWRYESCPFALPGHTEVAFIRVNGKIVSLSGGFRVRLWVAGIECDGEARGAWMTHPDYRGQNLWLRTQSVPHQWAPIQFGWSRLPVSLALRRGRPSNPVRPLVRPLDAGPLLKRYTHSRLLASIGSAATAATRVASSPFRRARGTVVRLNSFDERVDRLWERARRATRVMTVRDHRFLNWRYCQRPDETYVLYGVERGSELDGFLVARFTIYQGMKWGYLIDFLAAENARDVHLSLIDAAVDDFRRDGAAAVSCIATDTAARAALFRSGFFPAPQRKPINFMRRVSKKRPDLAKFGAVERWYLTMGEGDLELWP